LEDVRAFQVHLVSTGISWASLNQIVCALRFFYGVTLSEALIPERIPYAREPRKLPVVLSADEVVQFLEASGGDGFGASHTASRSMVRYGMKKTPRSFHRRGQEREKVGETGDSRNIELR
jgi:site-specific recombinase XerC